jgi:magnesium transporter
VETALLFERDAVDEVDDWQAYVDRLGRSSILWIDLEQPDEEETRRLFDALDLSDTSRRRLESPDGNRPQTADITSYLHVTVLAPTGREHRTKLARIECLVSPHWIVTIREGPVAVLDDFRERACGSGDIGRLDGLQFLANLLEWLLNGYLDAFEDLERELEEFDTRAMKGRLDDTDEELNRLVGLRRDVGELRRALTSHRETFLALTRPELEDIVSSDSAERFSQLCSRLENVVQAARDSRESIVASFDVLIARTEQRTNEIVKVLTLGSMLLLPGSLIAGVLGMNFKVGFFSHAEYFWVVLALIAGLAAATLAAARARRWI